MAGEREGKRGVGGGSSTTVALLALAFCLGAVAVPLVQEGCALAQAHRNGQEEIVVDDEPQRSQFSDWKERLQRIGGMQSDNEGRVDERFRIDWSGSKASKDVTVEVEGIVRVQMLHEAIARVELCLHEPEQGESCFEDRPSQVVWTRDLREAGLALPQLDITRSECSFVVESSALRVTYDSCEAGRFVAGQRFVTVEEVKTGKVWTYATHSFAENLGGSTRTLDRTNGKVRLSAGLLSRDGFTVLDDSFTILFDEDGWFSPRRFFQRTGLSYRAVMTKQPPIPYSSDIYFFSYGRDYQWMLDRATDISGGPSMLPRFALGNWWSRWWEYTDEELIELVNGFRSHEYPLGVLVVDMDWHQTQTGFTANPGWTGYTWNTTNFREPREFLRWAHEEQGLHVTLNLHPSEGCWPHEEAYPAFAELAGKSDGKPIGFDCGDPTFLQGYFDLLHHPHEDIGVDFWWIDWQQGSLSSVEGADPLFILNHYHYLDLGRARSTGPAGREDRRPFIFSRWPGIGGQRYPIGFSGDTRVSWESLAFQPSLTSTSANVLYGWWSHDIGGFMEGREDGELFTRWVQFGVFSPILRMHSVKTKWIDRRPWLWSDMNVQVNVKHFLQLRHSLVPYIYSMAWRNVVDNKALVRPMYHQFPSIDVAYCHPNQYFFGSELLVAPFVSPMDPLVGQSRSIVWLPPGKGWYDYFTGEYYEGGQVVPYYAGLDRLPVFARAGAIIPTQPLSGWGGLGVPEELDIHVFAGANGTFCLFEDDGTTQRYLQNSFAVTEISLDWHDSDDLQMLQLRIAHAVGDTSVLPAYRRYSVRVTGVVGEVEAQVSLSGEVIAVEQSYDSESETLTISGLSGTPQDDIEVHLRGSSLLSHRDRLREKYERMLREFRMDSYLKDGLDRSVTSLKGNDLVTMINYFKRMRPDLTSSLEDVHVEALLELLTGAGVDVVTGADADRNYVITFNNNAEDARMISTFGDLQDVQHRCYVLASAEEHSGHVTYYGNFRKPFVVPRG